MSRTNSLPETENIIESFPLIDEFSVAPLARVARGQILFQNI
jgi:hypothetical protein